MRATVRHEMSKAVSTYKDKPRQQWLMDYPAQVALNCSQIFWSEDVGSNAMKEYSAKQIEQLNTLINMLIGQLSPGDRQKIMTVCTIDVHARDVVAKIILQEDEMHCFVNICDAQFLYSYEYLGNTPRLVITPLTDRLPGTFGWHLHHHEPWLRWPHRAA
uniref:Uncharacterized protein n=1 Tax=Denticeps clupeoides TaxID=299321 RepID=A0AAY3ZXW1_9TELE